MKKYLIIILSLLIFASCENKKQKRENEQLTVQTGELSKQVSQKDSIITDVFSNMNEIASNLEAISGKQKIINTAVKEGGKSQDARSRIKESLIEISKLLEKNKATINALKANSKKLKNSNMMTSEEIAKLEALVEQLNKQIADKDTEITDLKDKLEKLNIKVAALTSSIDTLQTQKKELQTTVASKTEQLNTAYYIVGQEKDLKAKNIISKQGGFIGIGRNVSLKSTADLSAFIRIDITKFKTLKIDHKKIKIVSHHPAGSYQLTLDKRGFCDEITITEPDKFWQTSKYLVVVYK
ncbi:MAG: hypothetical protein Q8862_11285 [Bacteroidota bacterium]|nr:hypothetical protein [Bacteroidota bacterium]